MRRSFFLQRPTFLVTVLLIPQVSVQAASADLAVSIRENEKAARKACLAGDPTTGVEMLAQLFVDTHDFNYIFNQGRCYQQNHRYEDAISRFREYLKKAPHLSTADRAEAEKELAECQGFLKSNTTEPKTVPMGYPSQPSTQQTPNIGDRPPRQTNNSTPTKATESLTEVPPQPARTSPGYRMRLAGIACGAAAVLSVGTAVYFYHRATSLSDKITTSGRPTASDYESGKSAQTMQWVFYSLGATALATGTILYYLGWHAAEPGLGGLIPIASPNFAGLSATGAF